MCEKFAGLKVGEIAKKFLIPLLESGKITDIVVRQLQESLYSKQAFHLNFSLLKKAESRSSAKPERYYAHARLINGEYYFVCSEWYETSANNDRPYLIKWLERYLN